MDERSQKLVAGGMGITLALLYLYLFISCIWKYITTKDITNSTWELILIVMIPLSITLFARKDESLMIPKMVTTGQQLPTESNHQAKKERKRYYFWDALGLAAVFMVLTLLDTLFIQKGWDYFIFFPQWSEKVNIMIIFSAEFIVSLIIFYAIAYVWDEWNIKKYNRKMKELEETDE